jgi:hypothetical protein
MIRYWATKGDEVHSMSDLLFKLFTRHSLYPSPDVLRLRRYLELVRLPFDFEAQLREVPFPPQPGLPKGLESWIYYFVPHTKFGTDKNHPDSRSFLNAVDGMGLNLGCPVRLLRALDAVNLLQPDDQLEIQSKLGNAKLHLNAVEEILWLTGWKRSRNHRRGGRLEGARGDVDWALECGRNLLLLEAKFRSSSWTGVVDSQVDQNLGHSIQVNSGHKFPSASPSNAIHVVGITVFCDLDKIEAYGIGKALFDKPEIHAVVIRTMAQMSHVIAINSAYCDMVANLLEVPRYSSFPHSQAIVFNIEAQLKREENRLPKNAENLISSIAYRAIKPNGLSRKSRPWKGAYRFNIVSRGIDDEPIYQVVPQFLFG